MTDKISVIVPVYNVAAYLSDCLESIVRQTYANLEILLIDDGSQDNSADLCLEWSRKDARIRFLQKENGGVSSARNVGLEEASGEFVTFVDADDWIGEEMLDKLLTRIKEDKSDLAICGFREVDDGDRESLLRNRNAASNSGNYEVLTAKEYAGNYLLSGNTRCWSILFDKRLIGSVRFQEGLTIGEDLLFLVGLLAHLNKVSLLKSREYCYYRNGDGAMFSRFRSSYMDQITCWQRACGKIEQIYPEYVYKTRICLFQAALLTAGKLAVLSGQERKKLASYTQQCQKAAREAAEDRKAWKELPAGYKVKGILFLHAPSLYLFLYHTWKEKSVEKR